MNSMNDNKSRKKKLIIAAVLCGVILIGGLVLMIGGISAYLTETESVTNTFTVGEVTVDTLEPNYPGNGSDETTDMVAMQEVAKDPQIRNTGKNRVIAFIHVDIPMADIIVADEEGNKLPKGNTEIFNYRTLEGEYNSVHDEKWVELAVIYLDEDGDVTDKENAVMVRRLYGYNTVLEEDETTLPIFDVVRLCNIVEGEIDNSTQSIVIVSYAIQADNIAGVTSANWQETMDADKLNEIFEIYMNQSADVIPEDADNGNYQTITDTTLNLTMQVQNTHLKLHSGNPADTETTILFNVAYTGPNKAPVPVFESSNPDVATVDMYGQIKAVGVGTTTITMSAVNPDTDKLVAASVTVKVRDMNPDADDTEITSPDEGADDAVPGDDTGAVEDDTESDESPEDDVEDTDTDTDGMN